MNWIVDSTMNDQEEPNYFKPTLIRQRSVEDKIPEDVGPLDRSPRGDGSPRGSTPRSRPQSRGFFRLMIVVLILGLGYSAHAFLTGSNVDANKDKSMLSDYEIRDLLADTSFDNDTTLPDISDITDTSFDNDTTLPYISIITHNASEEINYEPSDADMHSESEDAAIEDRIEHEVIDLNELERQRDDYLHGIDAETNSTSTVASLSTIQSQEDEERVLPSTRTSFTSSTYSASYTNSARTRYARSQYFRACGGDTISIYGVCRRDQYLRLFNGYTEYAANDDRNWYGGDACSSITYRVPSYRSCSSRYVVRQGCYGNTACAGYVRVTVTRSSSSSRYGSSARQRSDCSWYSASNTNCATRNNAVCSYRLCGGSSIDVSGSCTGDTFFRLTKYARYGASNGYDVAANDDYGGSRCARLRYTAPGSRYSCANYYLDLGCYSSGSCSGYPRVRITVPARPSPTRQPTRAPTRRLTRYPTRAPTRRPTRYPTRAPTRQPTRYPTRVPTRQPTRYPTKQPTRYPTKQPTASPTTQADDRRGGGGYPNPNPNPPDTDQSPGNNDGDNGRNDGDNGRNRGDNGRNDGDNGRNDGDNGRNRGDNGRNDGDNDNRDGVDGPDGDTQSHSSSDSSNAISGVVIALIVVIGLLAAIVWYLYRRVQLHKAEEAAAAQAPKGNDVEAGAILNNTENPIPNQVDFATAVLLCGPSAPPWAVSVYEAAVAYRPHSCRSCGAPADRAIVGCFHLICSTCSEHPSVKQLRCIVPGCNGGHNTPGEMQTRPVHMNNGECSICLDDSVLNDRIVCDAGHTMCETCRQQCIDTGNSSCYCGKNIHPNAITINLMTDDEVADANAA